MAGWCVRTTITHQYTTQSTTLLQPLQTSILHFLKRYQLDPWTAIMLPRSLLSLPGLPTRLDTPRALTSCPKRPVSSGTVRSCHGVLQQQRPLHSWPHPHLGRTALKPLIPCAAASSASWGSWRSVPAPPPTAAPEPPALDLDYAPQLPFHQLVLALVAPALLCALLRRVLAGPAPLPPRTALLLAALYALGVLLGRSALLAPLYRVGTARGGGGGAVGWGWGWGWGWGG